MTTYSKKYFNEETQKWEPLYSTEGRSAYETAKLAGYTGSEEEFNIVLSRIPVIISSIENTPGKAGIFYGAFSSYSVSTVYVTRSNPNAVIVVPNITRVTFGSNYVKMKGLDDLSGGKYKCYCITYINTELVLVNGAIYG